MAYYLYSTYRLIVPRNSSSFGFITYNSANFLKRNSCRGFILAAATAVSGRNKQSKQLLLSKAINFKGLQQTIHSTSYLTNQSKNKLMNNEDGERTKPIVLQQISKNLSLYADSTRVIENVDGNVIVKVPLDKPLVIMLAWMLAKQKHLEKYSKIYIEQGYDVLIVETTPWQLLWPTSGSQVVAAELTKFLENNLSYSSFVLHGFSVGGYLWGECMVHMAKDIKRYQSILDKIVAQVWDSAADITEITVGVPKAIFPRNQMLQNALRNYCLYHLKTFHEQATQHYIRSSQIFHSTLVKAPALFFLSRNDPVGSERSNMDVRDTFLSIGINCTWQCWDRSAHVLHYQYHTNEYLSLLFQHLDKTMPDRISEKSRAKL